LKNKQFDSSRFFKDAGKYSSHQDVFQEKLFNEI